MSHKNLYSISNLEDKDIQSIFSKSKEFFDCNRKRIRNHELAGKTLINCFLEDSSRTRMSFEIAAKNLSCEVVNFNASASSINKGETYYDTVATLDAMNPDFIVIRQKVDGIDKAYDGINAHIINGGDGKREHPTQALLDAFTILQHKSKIEGLNIAIIGDSKHSRVAKSNIALLTRLGANVRLIAPQGLLLEHGNTYNDLESGLEGVDVIMLLRLQKERMDTECISSINDYSRLYGINHVNIKYARDNVIVMHPGPINRGIEISDELANDKSINVILRQVESGVAIRQAVLMWLINKE